MTVSELIEELKKLPAHHPVLVDVGLRYDESVHSICTSSTYDPRSGPCVVITTVSDKRNDPEPEIFYREADE